MSPASANVSAQPQPPPPSTGSSSTSSSKKKKKPAQISNLESHVSKAGWPVAPKVSSAKGRHAVAAKALEAGDLVAEEQTHLAMAANREVCANCFSLTNMETAKTLNTVDTCKGCSELAYCSIKCREAHAKEHAMECPVMSKLSAIAAANESTSDLLRFILLIIAHRNESSNGEAKENGANGSTTDRAAYEAPISAFFDIPTHRESFDKKFIKATTACAKAMKEALPEKLANVSESEIVDIACRISDHVVSRSDPDYRLNEAAYSFHPVTVQLFKHSCLPNCSLTIFPNGHNVIRALNPIQAGEELTICVLDPYMPRSDRQKSLMEKHAGKCDCIRCRVPLRKSIDRYLDGIVCMECAVGVYLPEEDVPKETKEQGETLAKVKAEHANGTDEKKNKPKKHVAFNTAVETHVLNSDGDVKDEIKDLDEKKHANPPSTPYPKDAKTNNLPPTPYPKDEIELDGEIKTAAAQRHDHNHAHAHHGHDHHHHHDHDHHHDHKHEHVHDGNCSHDDDEEDNEEDYQDLEPDQREAVKALRAKEREARTKQRDHKYYCESCGHSTHELEIRKRLNSAKSEIDQVMGLLQIPQFNSAQLIPALKEFLGRCGARYFPDMPVPVVAGHTSKESMSGALHPLNAILRDTRLQLLQMLVSAEDISTALQVARDQLALYNALHSSPQTLPSTWHEMGDMYHHLGDILFRMAIEKEESGEAAASARSRGKRGGAGAEEVLAKRYRNEAKEAYKKACEIRKVCYGETHPRTVESKKKAK